MILKRCKEIFTSVWPEDRQEKSFILAVMLCSFLINMDYGIIRPVSNSVFLSFFSSSTLPYLWLGVLPLNFLIVGLYNRYLPKLGCWRVFLILIGCIGIGNILAGFYLSSSPALSVLHFIWKETYILLLFQTLWSLIHMTVSQERAKSLYGVMFGIGGLGTVIGSFVPGFCALEMGSEPLLFFSIPILVLLGFTYQKALEFSPSLQAHTAFQRGGGAPTSLVSAIKMIKNSRILLYILLFVICMQLASTILDYQFNAFLQAAYPDKNLRTEFLGRIGTIVSSSTVFVQFLGSLILLRFLGLKGTHFFVPVVLTCNAVGFLIWPSLGMMAYSFASIKVFDFSLFGIVKEMLYIGLRPEEKFQAKALIDVFAYRGAKALAAILILGFQAIQFQHLNILTVICLAVFLVWCLSVASLFRRQEVSA